MKAIVLAMILLNVACKQSSNNATDDSNQDSLSVGPSEISVNYVSIPANLQILDYRSFSFIAPKSWKNIEALCYDSECGQIEIDSNQTIGFDLGWYSNRLNEKPEQHDTSWVYLRGYKAKVVTPKQSGKGITGVYIHSLWQSESMNVRFNLYGYHLNPKNEEALLQAIKTIKFHNYDKIFFFFPHLRKS